MGAVSTNNKTKAYQPKKTIQAFKLPSDPTEVRVSAIIERRNKGYMCDAVANAKFPDSYKGVDLRNYDQGQREQLIIGLRGISVAVPKDNYTKYVHMPIDITMYSDPAYNGDQMWQLRIGLEYAAQQHLSPEFIMPYRSPKFNWRQMNQIRLGLVKGIDVSYYANPKYDADQMIEMRFIIENHVDITPILNPKIPSEMMEIYYICETHGVDIRNELKVRNFKAIHKICKLNKLSKFILYKKSDQNNQNKTVLLNDYDDDYVEE